MPPTYFFPTLPVETVVQLNTVLPNHPGTLARMSDTLRAAGVNIDALFCEEGKTTTAVHLIVDDVETAKVVLREVSPVTTTDVLALPSKNKPGTIAQIARKCAGAGVNIHNIYATTLGKEAMVYLIVDDIEKAKKALK